MKKALAGIAAVSAVGTLCTGHAEATPPQASPTPATSIQNEAAKTEYTVEADALRVRTGPGTANAVLGIVNNGQALQVIGETDGWYQIQYSGQTAYVSKDYVKSETIQTSYTVHVSSLRVRTGPSTSHPVLGSVHKGQALTVVGEVQDWYKISYEGQTAYVSKDYVAGGQTTGASAPSRTLQSVPTNGTYVVTADSLRVRRGPSTYEGVIGGVVSGTALDVIGEQNGWYKIRHNGTTGFVSKTYVKFVQGSTAQETGKTVYYVTASALNVRNGAGTDYGIIGSLSSGTKVEASGEENGWLRISYNGGTGYISRQYTSKTQPGTGGTTAQPPSASALISYAKSLVGTPYVWGGTTPKGFDCSGFIYHVYSKNGYSFSRMSVASYWNSFTKTSNPQPGDLIYFQNTYKPGASHMGVYLGNGSFVQAGDSGVAISSLSNTYWKSHFLGYTKPY